MEQGERRQRVEKVWKGEGWTKRRRKGEGDEGEEEGWGARRRRGRGWGSEGERVWQRGGGGVMEGVGKMRRKREGRGDTEEG